jgi:hypothetical protein
MWVERRNSRRSKFENRKWEIAGVGSRRFCFFGVGLRCVVPESAWASICREARGLEDDGGYRVATDHWCKLDVLGVLLRGANGGLRNLNSLQCLFGFW